MDFPDCPDSRGGQSRRPGLVTQQAIDAFMHEPLQLVLHAGLGLAGFSHDGRSAKARPAQKHNPWSLDLLLRDHGISNDRP